MLSVNASEFNSRSINEFIRNAEDEITVNNCLGQRFIAAGLDKNRVTVNGTPGNALGAYLNGAQINVYGNAQDAVGDTMNNGEIIIHGNIGDAAGYAMRGGSIYIKGNAGYRAGIHMKEYKEKCPVMVIGGGCGSFLGEYQAGGIIIVLGIGRDKKAVAGDFIATGMHGGKIFLGGEYGNDRLPKYVSAGKANSEDMKLIEPYIGNFSELFGFDKRKLSEFPFTKIVPDSNNPYKQMYVSN